MDTSPPGVQKHPQSRWCGVGKSQTFGNVKRKILTAVRLVEVEIIIVTVVHAQQSLLGGHAPRNTNVLRQSNLVRGER